MAKRRHDQFAGKQRDPEAADMKPAKRPKQQKPQSKRSGHQEQHRKPDKQPPAKLPGKKQQQTDVSSDSEDDGASNLNIVGMSPPLPPPPPQPAASVASAAASAEQSAMASTLSQMPLPEGFGPGDRAALELKLGMLHKNKQGKLQPRDIQELVLWVLGQTLAPKWMLVRNKPLIQQVVVVVLDGLCSYNQNDGLDSVLLEMPEELFLRAPLRISYSRYAMHSVLDDFCLYPKKSNNSSAGSSLPPPPQQQQQQQQQPDAEGFVSPKNKKKKKKKDLELPLPETYMLSHMELEANEFPSLSTEPEFVSLGSLLRPAKRPKSDGGNPFEESLQQLVGIDCEMCRTERGLELARISAVDFEGKVVLDTLVKPPRPILDYLTQYSGITAEKLEGVQTTLKDVHERLVELLPEGTVLVGHSLENDLKALQLRYDRIIDTSLLYPHRRGPEYKTALKHLTTKYLKTSIQTAGDQGHDSIEDARSAMQLAVLKIRNGPEFGLVESEFEDFMDVVGRYNHEVHLVADPTVLRKAGSWAHRVPCSTDDEVFRKAKPLLASSNLAVMHLGEGLLDAVSCMIRAAPSASHNSSSNSRNLSAAAPQNRGAAVWTQDAIPMAAADSSDEDDDDKDPGRTNGRKAVELPETKEEPPSPVIGDNDEDPAAQAQLSIQRFRDCLGDTKKQLRELYNSLRPNTLFLMFGCRGHSQQMQELALAKQSRRNNPELGSWSLEEEELLNRLSNDSQTGVVFFSVKDGAMVDRDKEQKKLQLQEQLQQRQNQNQKQQQQRQNQSQQQQPQQSQLKKKKKQRQ